MEFEFQEQLDFIKLHFPPWSAISKEEVQFHRFAFGHSRATYKVTTSAKVQPQTLVLRKFVSVGEITPSRSKESYFFGLLGEKGIGPKCLASDPNFRIEENIESRVIKCHEINVPHLRRQLAKRLARIHKLEFDKSVLPSPAKGFITRIIDDRLHPTNFLALCAKNSDLKDVYTADEAAGIAAMQDVLTDEELEFIKKSIGTFDLVLSHNDIWSGNILLLADGSDVVFVDYEMMDYNFPGYDIGKLLLEPLYERHPSNPSYVLKGFEHFPSEEDVRDFVRHYLFHFHSESDAAEFSDSAFESLFGSKEGAEKELQDLVDAAMLGVMVSGFYSLVLGMAIGKNPNYELDFIQFAMDGHKVYVEFKKRYLLSQTKPN
eukprot:TRINITY_DN13882_c0_g1_i1.p1 TRINITY_DN13882_c0_g1~~TRINITY_DN13882_c0_g1_i1.p1  ORF type:complete len:396 (-),score=80.70 TRINITY_DN13882_c0_g1_i1:14-1138(-)